MRVPGRRRGAVRNVRSAVSTVLRAALRHPGMVPDLMSAAWAFRRRDWYRRPPFLPLPSSAYLKWRLDTEYGDPEAVPPIHDLRRFLRWARTARRGYVSPRQENRWAD